MSATEHEATRSKAEDSEDRVIREIRRIGWHVSATVYIVGLVVFMKADTAAGGPNLASIITCGLLLLLFVMTAWWGRPRK